jgi:hypothetical protein
MFTSRAALLLLYLFSLPKRTALIEVGLGYYGSQRRKSSDSPPVGVAFQAFNKVLAMKNVA